MNCNRVHRQFKELREISQDKPNLSPVLSLFLNRFSSALKLEYSAENRNALQGV